MAADHMHFLHAAVRSDYGLKLDGSLEVHLARNSPDNREDARS